MRSLVLITIVLVSLLQLMVLGTYSEERRYIFSGSWRAVVGMPAGMTVDRAGNVYVADHRRDQIQKFSPNGDLLETLGKKGDRDKEFNSPSDVAVDRAGNLYVADLLNHRIQKFTPDGIFITKWGIKDEDNERFKYPTALAVDNVGNVYVVDSTLHRIRKFTSDGEFLTEWGEKGQDNGEFDQPEDIAVDSAGNVYVADVKNNRIQKFTSDGKFLTKWGDKAFGPDDGFGVFGVDKKLLFPRGLAVDKFRNVYVVHSKAPYVQIFTSNGTLLSKWGEGGKEEGEFNHPMGIAVDRSGKNIYIADVDNRIQRFELMSPQPGIAVEAEDKLPTLWSGTKSGK